MTGEEYQALRRKERRKQYYLDNRERILARNRSYAKAHRDEIREYHREYMRSYRKRKYLENNSTEVDK